jgi:ribulose 1,5-bisphosphate synthetase/thiazole synthase
VKAMSEESKTSNSGAECSGHIGTIEWTRRVPLRYEADVAVIGGGSAGVCAA